MMMRALLIAAVLTAGLPTLLAAQDAATSPQGQQAGPATAPGDTAVVELVLRREVFAYPTFVRQNPFVPLTSSEAGPRFDQMRLTGILVDADDATRSLAVIAAVGFGQGQGNDAGDGIGLVERLRIGDRWGNVRIVSIESTRVVVDVNNFGIVERREMRLQSRGQGGS